VGLTHNGQPFDYPGRGLAEQSSDGNYWLLPHVVGPHRELEEMHVFEDIMQLVDWIRDGTPSIVTAEHARHVVEIIEAAYRAAETGQTQELKTTF
jgi:predicted dehydrogenase